jgi:5'-nucleotidase
MRILVTNDDGINAPSLEYVVQWAKKYGEVEIFAPKVEQSAKSHAIELYHAFEVKRVHRKDGTVAYSVDSTPADCVRVAVLGFKRQYDLVISGINNGYNVGVDILYSGTVGAVLEAGNLGVQAIAFSTEPKNYDHATEHLDRIWAFIQEHKLLQRNDLYNINIPKDAGSIRITRQGGPYYSDEFINLENSMVSPHGIEVFVPCGNMEIDTDAVLCGKLISIMPLTLEKTDLQVFGELKYLNN